METVAAAGKMLAENDSVKKMVLGTYSDGSARSIPDALNDEFVSPKEKKKILYGDDKKRKNKKNKKKKKNSVKFKL
jgi:hypothetical protein